MKKNIILLAFISIISLKANSQTDLITLNSGYENQSFYSLENGEILNVENTNWDLAFSTDAYSANIRINGGKGVELYIYPNGDTSEWGAINISTPNILTTSLHNSDTSWNYGAFISTQSNDMFDYGWGVYNIQTHNIVGDSLFIIKTIDGNWKKLFIKRKASGEYFFKFSDLDGSNEVNENILGTAYPNKRFIYYSLENEMIIDREPDLSSWDITFTKYITPVQNIPYSVTGALSNVGIKVAEANNLSNPLIYNDFNNHPFEIEMNSLGYDWKQFQGSYVIINDRCYFVRDQLDNIWRLTFINFEGTSTGNIEFNTELIGGTKIEDIEEIRTFKMYPNPVKSGEKITLVYDLKSIQAKNIVKMHDISGHEVYKLELEGNSLKIRDIDTRHLKKGIYIITININGKESSDRVVIN